MSLRGSPQHPWHCVFSLEEAALNPVTVNNRNERVKDLDGLRAVGSAPILFGGPTPWWSDIIGLQNMRMTIHKNYHATSPAFPTRSISLIPMC